VDTPPPLPPRSFSQSSSFTSIDSSSYPLPPGYSPQDPSLGHGGQFANNHSQAHFNSPSNTEVVSTEYEVQTLYTQLILNVCMYLPKKLEILIYSLHISSNCNHLIFKHLPQNAIKSVK
jgi:hypothetical protein